MNQSFCPAAWNSIYVDPTGSIRNCCVASEDIGTVDDDISNVFNGNKNIWIKQQMLEGNLVDSCRQCWPDSQHSVRDGFLHDYYRPETAANFDDINKFQLQYLDLRWHNTCNFACVYCGHVVSSSWAAELGIHQRMDSDQVNKLKDYILDNLEHVNHVYLAGGEPLLMKENTELLERLHTINPNVRIFVNSNISHAKPSNAVYQQLQKFPNTFWIISAEDTGDRFDYIRHGGNWQEFVNNLAQIEQDFQHHQIAFNAVMCALNGLSIWNFVDWIVDRGYKPLQCSISLYYQGTKPQLELDPRVIGSDFVDKILQRAREPKYSSLSGINGLISNLEDTKESVGPQVFLDFIQVLDKRRGLDSQQVFPDVYSYIDISN
jgi:molybdenum cofactor biosynthesis enzyme MoaA